MKNIRMMMDYQCYPIWIYDEKGDLICNDLPAELKNENEIGDILDHIQTVYDSLFVDDEIQFDYQGFADETAKREFEKNVLKVLGLIESKVGKLYKIENRIDID
ncbi:hypothetical protein [Pectinatus frisingensis]|uniref:hypothetical protein n=1 Tax=Pectinatus frisingensis TaxID=865 RepID=UPI0018C842EE|nr:hypothetical protein [Pectinatus frisingensis]